MRPEIEQLESRDCPDTGFALSIGRQAAQQTVVQSAHRIAAVVDLGVPGDLVVQYGHWDGPPLIPFRPATGRFVLDGQQIVAADAVPDSVLLGYQAPAGEPPIDSQSNLNEAGSLILSWQDTAGAWHHADSADWQHFAEAVTTPPAAIAAEQANPPPTPVLPPAPQPTGSGWTASAEPLDSATIALLAAFQQRQAA